MKVSIIIPNYNTIDLLKKNLPFIVGARKNPANNISEIIIVDNGSTDGSVEYVKDYFPEIKLIKHKVNRGFSAAVNTGARMAKSGLICLLNTDVIPSKNFLVSVLPHFNNRKIFAVSLNEAGVFSWAKGNFKSGFIVHEPGPKISEPHSTFWVSGGTGVFRRDVWMRLGGMDERLLSPFYWEDLDISYRAMKRGYQLIWEPNAKVEHKHESTVRKFPKYFVARIRERNELLFIWKNITSESLIKRHFWALVGRIFKHPGYLRIFLMAISKVRLVREERAIEAKESEVSDEAIFSRFN